MKTAFLASMMIGSVAAFAPSTNNAVRFSSLAAAPESNSAEPTVSEVKAEVKKPVAPVLSSSSGTAVVTDIYSGETFERSEATPWLMKRRKLNGYVGDVGFDPLGLSENLSMEFLREAELKHGRMAMLAWLGWVSVDSGLRIYPCPSGWENINSLEAHSILTDGGYQSSMGYILQIVAIVETFQVPTCLDMFFEKEGVRRAAGDLNCDFLGFTKNVSEEEVNKMKLKEVKHARLGMLAFGGVVLQSAVLGSNAFPYF